MKFQNLFSETVIGFDNFCSLSVLETLCMKCQNLFWVGGGGGGGGGWGGGGGGRKKNKQNMLSAENFT